MLMPLFSPQSYCQFNKLDKDTTYYGGNSMDFFLRTVDHKKLQISIYYGTVCLLSQPRELRRRR